MSITGQRFGRWLVIGNPVRRNGNWVSLCRCNCGTERPVRNRCLILGETQSCGCRIPSLNVERYTVHGHASTVNPSKTYRTWMGMIQRCTNPEANGFENYGGRGITVCDRWRRSFENFLEDMGEKPAGLTLGRIDNDAGYSQANCRWETWTQQQRNRRSNRIMTVRGVTDCVTNLCEHFKVPYKRTVLRLFYGWSVERAFFAPSQRP